MLKEIYAPNGEKFEVPARKADELKVFHGWTFEPPKPETSAKVEDNTPADKPKFKSKSK